MSGRTQLARIWSDDLGRHLLASLPDADLVGQWGAAPPGGPGGTAESPHLRLRRDLLNWARQDEEVCRWIVEAWREAHADVVAAADQALTEGLTADSVKLLEGFTAEHVLLALLTDEFDDGAALAKRFVALVSTESQRRALLPVLRLLMGEPAAAPQDRIRVVILGGHPRDESKLGRQLFGASPFEVRWRTFERKPSGGLVRRGVASVLREAGAALIITGMASHALMQCAKDYARRSSIPWKCVEKATDKQMRAALCELFPALTTHWR